MAVVLDFAAAGASLAVAEVLGSVVEAEVALYPGSEPRRALFTGDRSVVGSTDQLPAAGVAAALDQVATWVAANPFADRFPVALAGVVPVVDGRRAGWWWSRAAAPCRLSERQRLAVAPGALRRRTGRPVRRVGRVCADPAERRAPRAPWCRCDSSGDTRRRRLRRPARPPWPGRACSPRHWWAPRAAARRTLLSWRRRGRRPRPRRATALRGPCGRAAWRTAAVLSAYRRAGQLPAPAPRSLPAPAEPDERPPCSTTAVEVLELILSGEVPIPGGVALLAGQWLEGAARAGCRVPARLLPRLLDLGSVSPALQAALRVGGRAPGPVARRSSRSLAMGGRRTGRRSRGRLRQRFATAAKGERPAILEAVRRADATRGRDLLSSTWKSDPAAERAALLAGAGGRAVRRRRTVPGGSARRPVGGRAPGSRRPARPAAGVAPGGPHGGTAAGARAQRRCSGRSAVSARRPGRSRTLSFAPPGDPDAAARRDGINDTAPAGMGSSAWRLMQLVAGAPLRFWTEHLGLSPAEAVALATADSPPARTRGASPAGPLLLGLESAVVAQAGRADPGWAVAVFAHRPTPAVLAALPPDLAAEQLTGLLRGGLGPSPAVAELFAACPGPWPESLGRRRPRPLPPARRQSSAGAAGRAARPRRPPRPVGPAARRDLGPRPGRRPGPAAAGPDPRPRPQPPCRHPTGVPLMTDPITFVPADVVRPHAEDLYAAELAALAAADDRPRPPELAAVAVGGRDLPARREAARRHRDHAEVHRPAAPRRGGRRHAGHRPGPAAARRARHGQDLGVGASGRRRLGRLHAPRAGHVGHAGRGHPLRVELRPAAGRGPVPRRGGGQPGHAGHGAGRAGPHRGAHPHPVRRAGRPHHDPLREDAADPRARRRGAGPAGLQRDRHRQRPRPGRQRAVVGA